jgi:hypothetical protein
MRYSNMQCWLQKSFFELELTDDQVCSETKKCRVTTVSAHMQLCQARCSKCFYSDINKLSRPCRCCDARATDRRSYYIASRDVNNNKDRLLCRDCFRMKDGDLQVLREKRDRVTYTKLTRQPHVHNAKRHYGQQGHCGGCVPRVQLNAVATIILGGGGSSRYRHESWRRYLYYYIKYYAALSQSVSLLMPFPCPPRVNKFDASNNY